jgi:8-oxo-dGTP pyrophosphatase MutT (NUDIX family)
MTIPRPLLRFVLTGLQLLRRAAWKLTGMQGEGVHAVVLTPHGKVVLIRLTYASGWRLPGGGKGRSEAREEAMLRELREEIGLVRHGGIRQAPGSDARDGYFLVTDAEIDPHETYEVDEVRAFDPDDLPDDMPDCVRDIVIETLGLGPGPGGTGGTGPSLARRTDPQTEKIMSRIPTKAMPHAYAPGEGETETGGAEGGRSIADRAGEIAKKVGGSKAARVAAGAVVAAGVAAAATRIVRSRRKTGGGDSSGGGSGSGGTAKKSGGRKSSSKSTSSSS